MKTLCARIAAAGTGLLCLLWFNAAEAGPLYLAEQLVPLPGDNLVQANSLNAEGEVVGYSRNADGTASTVLRENGTVRDLTQQSTFEVAFVANEFNDLGQIVGSVSVCDTNPCRDLVNGNVPVPLGAGPWAAACRRRSCTLSCDELRSRATTPSRA